MVFSQLFNDQDLTHFKEHSITPKLMIFSFQLKAFIHFAARLSSKKKTSTIYQICAF